ncbi:MAG: mechanosensitive ion channel family protein [Bacteroidota bacterium]
MFSSLISLLKNISYPYQVLIILLFSGLATIFLHILYKKTRDFLYTKNMIVSYIIAKAIYPPSLVYAWISILWEIGYQGYQKGYLPSFPMGNEQAIIQQILMIALATSITMRMVNTVSELLGSYFLKQWRIQSSFLRFGVRMLNLGILVVFGFASLHIISLPISRTLSNATIFVIVWAITLLAAYFLYLLSKSIKKRMAMKEEFLVGHELIIKLINPFILMLIGSATIFSIQELKIEGSLFSYVSYYEIAQLAFFWTLFRLTALFEGQFLSGSLTETTSNKTMVQATGNFIRAALGFVIILVLMRKMKYDVKGIVTLLGGASVAISFAGRDIFANYLSGIVIYSEGQFRVGDWIYSTSNEKIQGHIEYIGMRTTSIRTFDKRLLLVPNSFFSSNSIVNASRMTNRRIKKEIPLGWLTSREIVEKIVQEIRLLIYNHPGIDKITLSPLIHFTGFEQSKVVITVYALTRTRNWHTYLNVQENILREIKTIIEKNGAVPPTDLMHVENHPSIPTQTGYNKLH